MPLVGVRVAYVHQHGQPHLIKAFFISCLIDLFLGLADEALSVPWRPSISHSKDRWPEVQGLRRLPEPAREKDCNSDLLFV